jgi:hypothetical protein
MPVTYYKHFGVTGVINTTVYDGGIESTEAEKITVKALLISISAYQGNLVEGWLEREKIVDIPDYCLNTHEAAGAANAYKSTVKMLRIPVELALDIGKIFKVAINSGGTANNIFGAYEYEIAG